MAPRCGLWICLAALMLLGQSGHADDGPPPVATDANIATGIDISDSVGAADIRAQVAGLAAALRSPEVLAAIQRGRHGRIGFAVFAWCRGHLPVIVGWQVVGSAAEADAAATMVEAFELIDADYRGKFYSGRLTDLSQAIDHGRELLDAAPFPAGRSVLNVIGNGEDNVGEDVGPARDRIVEAGFTLNGVVSGGDATLAGYYRDRVAGGWGAFVIAADGATSMAAALQRKLTWDIAGPPPGLRTF